MCQPNIRRLTPDEHEDRRYEELYAQIEAEAREEHDREFGPAYRDMHPFRSDGRRIHAEVMASMQQDNELVDF